MFDRPGLFAQLKQRLLPRPVEEARVDEVLEDGDPTVSPETFGIDYSSKTIEELLSNPEWFQAELARQLDDGFKSREQRQWSPMTFLTVAETYITVAGLTAAFAAANGVKTYNTVNKWRFTTAGASDDFRVIQLEVQPGFEVRIWDMAMAVSDVTTGRVWSGSLHSPALNLYRNLIWTTGALDAQSERWNEYLDSSAAIATLHKPPLHLTEGDIFRMTAAGLLGVTETADFLARFQWRTI